jgi:hypothetical protein
VFGDLIDSLSLRLFVAVEGYMLFRLATGCEGAHTPCVLCSLVFFIFHMHDMYTSCYPGVDYAASDFSCWQVEGLVWARTLAEQLQSMHGDVQCCVARDSRSPAMVCGQFELGSGERMQVAADADIASMC